MQNYFLYYLHFLIYPLKFYVRACEKVVREVFEVKTSFWPMCRENTTSILEH